MKDIARDLGVSAVTVSKVLRDHPDIGQSTKERVLKRVQELQYRPNLMARSLVTGRTSLIALVIPDLVHGFFAEIAISISEVLRKHGYTTLIAWTAEDEKLQLSEIEHLLSFGADAMVIATSGSDTACFDLLQQRDVPFVLLDRDVRSFRVPYVGVDDLLVGRMATEHLIKTGCKRIGHIMGPPMSPGLMRFQGYKDALEAGGLPFREKYVVTPAESGPRSFHHGFEAAQRLLKEKPQIDGMFCFNDPMAIGAIEAVLAAKLRIPKDVAIIGVGNHPLGQALRLPLSTVDQDAKALGEKSAKAVLALLNKNKKSSSRRTVLKSKLILRATTH
ncbi:MAG TPA: LacI family DNA-binding transcriptional regulator [Bryocella sp.]|nr:LacI family DNA-binding transcriptional regulator [Bryocella sp.]